MRAENLQDALPKVSGGWTVDQETKREIKQFVLDLRKMLEGDIETVLKRYGIFTDRDWLPLEKIPKVADAVREKRRRLEAAMQPERARGLSEREAARLYVREAAFTHLNRLVGLKVLEVRGLIPEVIQTRPEYGGRSLYHRDFRAEHPDLAQQPDDALPAALEAACREVSQQVKFVFDVDSESAIVWPRYKTLKEAIDRINSLPVEIWQEDEIIGWIYQFYNAEEKKQIRKRGRPRLPIEVAVINQFFTPRWIVKFLVDNTLGRLWLEMHPDSERVRRKCDYLVPEPLPPEEGEEKKDRIRLDPNSPINNPQAPRRREVKRPQKIRLIDPACGTMHFGHYAFEVFQEIYRDARDRGWVTGPDALDDKDIPLAILKHNLYGVDIDLRAVQLAALSLYIKARTAQREAGMSDEEAARLSWQVNLACADARLTDGGLREKFLQEYADDPVLQRAWKELFREMEDIAQVGSLLRVEERFRQILAEYSPPTVADVVPPRQEPLPGVPAPPRQMHLAEAPGGKAWSPRRTLQEMLADLRRFARDALEGDDVNGQVFATEAEKALGLLDVLMQKYDVVVMNPPYGTSNAAGDRYLKEVYPNSRSNLYCAFIIRSLELVGQRGYIGAIVDRTFLVKASFKDFRRRILLEDSLVRILTLVDQGWGVLDSWTETASMVLQGADDYEKCRDTVFIKIRDDDDKHRLLQKVVFDLKQGLSNEAVFVTTAKDFRRFPNSSMSFWIPRSLQRAFRDLPRLDPEVFSSRVGISSGANKRFYRQRWEVNQEHIGPGKRWRWLANGGPYSPYYRDTEYVIDWGKDGQRIKKSPGSYIRNERYYFKAGLTWGKRTDYLNLQILPPGHIFTNEGQALFPHKTSDGWWILGLLNSRLMQYAISTIAGLHKEAGYVGRLPCQIPDDESRTALEDNASTAYLLKAAWDTGNEICTRFDKPWLLQVALDELLMANGKLQIAGQTFDVSDVLGDVKPPAPLSDAPTLAEMLDYLEAIEAVADCKLQRIQAEIDEAVYDLYEITPEDRALIERELGDRPPELVWPQMEGKSAQEKRQEHVRRLLSYYILQSLKEDPDGIIPLVKIGDKLTVLDCLRQKLEAEFGEARAFQMEEEAGHVLGKPVERWLQGDFINWHTKLYKKRPIIWHISSPRRTFGCLVYYHKLTRDTLLSVRTVYLWRLRDQLNADLKTALDRKDYRRAGKLETALEDLEALDQALEGILNQGWTPDLDAGVKANILPLQEAGVLRYKKVV